MNDRHLTKKQRQEMLLKEAQGQVCVLAIGIDAYDKSSGFPPLNTCSNDAIEVRNAFQDVWQLNADKNRLYTLTSKGDIKPSRGEIIKAINRLSNEVGPDDRLLLYYSGHGHRMKAEDGSDRFYLVPQDCYSDTEPDALILFDKILATINKSEAKLRILILDACMSGPDITGNKLLPAKYSPKYLAEYMQNTTGAAIISSSRADQTSTTQSPNPKLSLFTYYFIKALRGEQSALDDTMLLNINSLYEFISTEVHRRAKSYQKSQLPSINVQSSGVIIFGNFAQSILSPDSFDLEGYPVRTLAFKEKEGMDVKDVLTEIRRWSAYSEEYLEGKVNANLGSYLEETLGKKTSNLRRAMGFSVSDVSVSESSIAFPGGCYYCEYKASNIKTGTLITRLDIEKDWFARSSDIASIIESLDMTPDEMVLELEKDISPETMIPGLETRGWTITSQLQRKIVATASTYTLTAEYSRISFKGFTPRELFGDKINKDKTALASSVLALLTGVP